MNHEPDLSFIKFEQIFEMNVKNGQSIMGKRVAALVDRI